MPASPSHKMGLFIIQKSFLKLCGMLPVTSHLNVSSVKLKYLGMASTILGVCLLLGSFYQTAVQCSIVVCDIISSAGVFNLTAQADVTLLNVLSDLPFCCIHLRGFLVITLTFVNRHKWHDLNESFHHLIHTAFPEESYRLEILTKWKKRSAWFALLTFIGHVMWETGDWLYYTTAFPRTYAMNASSLLSPLPMKITTWKYLILYTLFCIVPFVLSQQVFTCLIVMAGVLMNALKDLRYSIAKCAVDLLEHNRRKYPRCHKNLCASEKYGNESDEVIEAKVEVWQQRHMEILIFLRQLNKFFNWMLFVIYGLDFMTCLGFAAHVANNTSTVIESHVFLLFSAFVFAAYATVFLVPLVAVFEHSCKLPFELLQLSSNLKQKDDKYALASHYGYALNYKQEKGVVDRVECFERTCSRYHCTIEGGGLFICTRGLLVGTLTLTLSLVVLIKEFVEKTEGRKECPASVPKT